MGTSSLAPALRAHMPPRGPVSSLLKLLPCPTPPGQVLPGVYRWPPASEPRQGEGVVCAESSPRLASRLKEAAAHSRAASRVPPRLHPRSCCGVEKGRSSQCRRVPSLQPEQGSLGQPEMGVKAGLAADPRPAALCPAEASVVLPAWPTRAHGAPFSCDAGAACRLTASANLRSLPGGGAAFHVH